MPDMKERLAELSRQWKEHAWAVLSKAPRERPDLVIVVFVLALVLLALFGLATTQHVR